MDRMNVSRMRLMTREAYAASGIAAKRWQAIEFLALQEIHFVSYSTSWVEIIENAVFYDFPINARHPIAADYYAFVQKHHEEYLNTIEKIASEVINEVIV